MRLQSKVSNIKFDQLWHLVVIQMLRAATCIDNIIEDGSMNQFSFFDHRADISHTTKFEQALANMGQAVSVFEWTWKRGSTVSPTSDSDDVPLLPIPQNYRKPVSVSKSAIIFMSIDNHN